MVIEAAHVRIVEQLFPAAVRDSCAAHLLATKGGACAFGCNLHSERMQKALTQMNLQLANVISDLSGLSGQKIVRAILAGERNAEKLAELTDPRIRASRAEVAKSLEGNWRPELLFVLQQEVDLYDTCQRRMQECDEQLQRHLNTFNDKSNTQPPAANPEANKPNKHRKPRRCDAESESCP